MQIFFITLLKNSCLERYEGLFIPQPSYFSVCGFFLGPAGLPAPSCFFPISGFASLYIFFVARRFCFDTYFSLMFSAEKKKYLTVIRKRYIISLLASSQASGWGSGRDKKLFLVPKPILSQRAESEQKQQAGGYPRDFCFSGLLAKGSE